MSMTFENTNSHNRLVIGSIAVHSTNTNDVDKNKPVSYHRRGQWFKSTIAYHVTGLHNEELPLRDLIEALLGAEGKRRLMLRRTMNEM